MRKRKKKKMSRKREMIEELNVDVEVGIGMVMWGLISWQVQRMEKKKGRCGCE